MPRIVLEVQLVFFLVTQEIQKEFSGHFFQCRDESETLGAVHMIEVQLYLSLRKAKNKKTALLPQKRI